jgi:large subunit ribosomal protein L9
MVAATARGATIATTITTTDSALKENVMKVILMQELKGKGGEGDVIDVAQGFADNYLLPQGIAIKATKGNLKQLEQRMHNIKKREAVRIENADDMQKALDGKGVTIVAKVGEDGQLFGSVTPVMIADALKEQLDIEIDRKKIDLNKPIKTAGEHVAVVSIYRDIKANINVSVKSEEMLAAEAEAAEKAAKEAEANAEVAEVNAAEAVAEAETAEAEAAEAEAVAEVVETEAADAEEKAAE